MHCVHQGFVNARAAQVHQIRGLLGEFGLVVPQGIGSIASRVPKLIEAASSNQVKVSGIDPITVSARVASMGDAKRFDNGRPVAAWPGRVPKQHSSAGKQNLPGISKRVDTYLRTLRMPGARAVVYWADKKPDSASRRMRAAKTAHSVKAGTGPVNHRIDDLNRAKFVRKH